MSIRKLYASVSTTTAAAASIEILRPGRLVAVGWSQATTAGFAAGIVYQVAELSRSSASQATTSDTVDVLDHCSIGGVETTSGAVAPVHKQTLLDIPLRVGDRLYLHVTATGTGTARHDVFLHIKD